MKLCMDFNFEKDHCAVNKTFQFTIQLYKLFLCLDKQSIERIGILCYFNITL